jgi:hypothetical protein
LINQKNDGPTCQSQARRPIVGLTRAPAARPRAGGPSAATVVGPVRRPVRLIPLRMIAVEKLPPTSTPPRAISPLPLPCHQLPSSIVRTSLVPSLYAPPRPHLHLLEHHRALGYHVDLSILTDERPSDPSPEPYLPPPRAHTIEPPSIQNPKLGPPPLWHVSR